jgi:hypothetical protein
MTIADTTFGDSALKKAALRGNGHGLGDRWQHPPGLSNGAKIDEDDPVPKGIRQLQTGLEREARLPHACRSRQR